MTTDKTKMENSVKIAAKLYECRDAAKSLAKMQGVDYKEMLATHTYIIKQVMQSNKVDEISALLRISKTKNYEDSGIAQLLFMAAVVELIESHS